jgi:hypothetical protein
MVYAHIVNRVTLSGTMFGGAEQWSTGFFLGQESANAADGSTAACDAILNAWRTFFTSTTSYVSSQYVTTQCKIAKINTDGHTDLAKVFYGYPATALVGQQGTNTHPPQCTLALTLQSDRPRGLASKGRMYLPGISAAMQGDGKISAANRDSICLNMKTFFDTIAANADVPDTLILAAKGTGPFPEFTAQNDFVQTIKLGNVIDTQRRRRNGLVESYVQQTLTF